METLIVAVVVLLMGLALAVFTVAWMWKALQGAGANYIARLDAQEAEIDDLRRQIQELREGRIADYALLQEWIAYARRLGQMVRDLTGQEPPAEPAANLRPIAQTELTRLARAIQSRYSAGELSDLTSELGVSDWIEGDTHEARSRSLVDVAKRRGLLARLVALLREQRPNGGF